MKSYTLRVTLYGYWHAGTGRGNDAGADAVVARDHDGLPVVAGSHLRGLLRHALRQRAHFAGDSDTTELTLLGSRADRDPEEAQQAGIGRRFLSEAGTLTVGDALVPVPWRAVLTPRRASAGASSELDLRPLLHQELHTTAIDDETGTVEARTLRTVEVTVPVPLEASLTFEVPPSGAQLAHVREALTLIRAIGKHRTRGLGRARIELVGG